MYKNIVWNTGPAAMRARHNLKLKKNKKNKEEQASSIKPQASSPRRLKKNIIMN